MDFPPNIKLDEDTRLRLVSYLNAEIVAHRAERSNWVNDLTNWQLDYWAKPTEEIKTFPFKGACNLINPLMAIAVEAVHAKEMTTLFALDQFVNYKLSGSLSDISNDLELVTDKILTKDVDIYKFLDNSFLENKKLGSMVGKDGWEKRIKRAIKYEGDTEIPFDVIVKQGATLKNIPLANFLMPFVCQDPQMAPWCGEEHLDSPYVVKSLAETDFFFPSVFDDLGKFISTGTGTNQSSAPYIQAIRESQDQLPIQWPNEIAWFELWLSFDVDGDGKDEEIVVHYHYESQQFFSIRYNWYSDLHRPYEIGNYFPMENRWAGIGIGKQVEQFQMEATTLLRQRIDNGTLANMRMYKVKQGIGYGSDEPIFPGKIWLVEEKDDVGEIIMSEIYPSGYNNDAGVQMMADKRTGVSEVTLGSPTVGTPDTATGSLSKVQEANRKFDYTFKNAKRYALNCSKRAIQNSIQFGVSSPRIFSVCQPQNVPIITELFKNNDMDMWNYDILDNMSLAGQNANRLVDRNTWTQLSGITQQYFTSMFQIAQFTQNPALMQALSTKAFEAATEIYKQILEAYDVRQLQKILPNLMPPTPNGLSQQPSAIPATAGGSTVSG